MYALLFLSLSNYQVAKIFKKYGYLIFIPSTKNYHLYRLKEYDENSAPTV